MVSHPRQVVVALPPLKNLLKTTSVGPRGDHDGEVVVCSSAQPSGMDMGIMWAVDMMLKSQDANSHLCHRKTGPVSGWDPGSCRNLSARAGGWLVGLKRSPAWWQSSRLALPSCQERLLIRAWNTALPKSLAHGGCPQWDEPGKLLLFQGCLRKNV